MSQSRFKDRRADVEGGPASCLTDATSAISDAINASAEPAPPQLGRNDGLDRLQLLAGVHPQINLFRSNVGVPQPQRDVRDVAGRLQYDHRTAMPKLM